MELHGSHRALTSEKKLPRKNEKAFSIMKGRDFIGMNKVTYWTNLKTYYFVTLFVFQRRAVGGFRFLFIQYS